MAARSAFMCNAEENGLVFIRDSRVGRRGITIIDVLIAVFVVLIVIVVVVSTNAPVGRIDPRHPKDATQVRNIVQAMTIFANGNKDVYPLPSRLDLENATVAEQGEAKDTTANILSILIFNLSISPELCVSPNEASESIMVDIDYENSKPSAAVVPPRALWDPAFRGDFTSAEGGNLSYATLQTSEQRRAQWSNTFNATEAVFGNRGPEIASYSPDRSTITTVKKESVTFAIHGGRKTWEGNIGYNDNHVNFETTVAPEEITYQTSLNKSARDILFADEPDDAKGFNAYLGVWVRGGLKPAEFKGIWD